MTEALSIPYPWQQPYWQSFLNQYEQNRLPHAVLLSGQKGVGKWHYAQAMANFLLCAAPRSGLACGECRGCKLNQAETHPDKSMVVPEETGKQIKIDQVRRLSERIGSTAQQGGRKIIILGPVEHLNTNAANALLKSLEEPTQDTFFILFTHIASGVIATIRSRCQLFAMAAPSEQVSMSWLKDLGFTENLEIALLMSAGAPIAARELLENEEKIDALDSFISGLSESQNQQLLPDLSVIKVWLDLDLSMLLEWWIQLLYRGLGQNYRLSPPSDDLGQLAISLTGIQVLLKNANQHWSFRFVDKLLLAKKQLIHGANPNKQLLLEELLLDWYAIIKTATPRYPSISTS